MHTDINFLRYLLSNVSKNTVNQVENQAKLMVVGVQDSHELPTDARV